MRCGTFAVDEKKTNDMQFKDVIGQQPVKQELIRSVEEDKLSHAQLLLGESGTGALPLALAYAQYLNCQDRQEGDSCGKCPACLKAQKYIHPDIHFSFPFIANKTDKKELSQDYLNEWRQALTDNPYLGLTDWLPYINAEGKQVNINIKECAEIIKTLSLKTYEAPYKVMILWLPEYLGKEGNTLLKMIEEPPDNTVFLLVADDQDPILNTILSRTQIIRVSRIDDEALENALKEVHNLPEDQAHQLTAMAEGNYRSALTLLKEGDKDNEEQLKNWLRYSYAGVVKQKTDMIQLYQWIEDMGKSGREYQKGFLSYTLRFFRELLMLAMNPSAATKLVASEKEFAEQLLKGISMDAEKLQTINQLINDAFYAVERNANAKIMFLNLSIKVAKVMKGENVKQKRGELIM